MKTLSTTQNQYPTIRISALRLLSIALGGLLLYTATKKVMDLAAFSAHLELLPYIGQTATHVLTAGVVLIEYALGIFILYRYLSPMAYLLLLGLMFVYTGYIYYILNHAPFLPCSCQGAFKSLSWEMHYAINAAVGVLSATAWGLLYRQQKHNETL